MSLLEREISSIFINWKSELTKARRCTLTMAVKFEAPDDSLEANRVKNV
jgi:hypothetical protein